MTRLPVLSPAESALNQLRGCRELTVFAMSLYHITKGLKNCDSEMVSTKKKTQNKTGCCLQWEKGEESKLRNEWVSSISEDNRTVLKGSRRKKQQGLSKTFVPPAPEEEELRSWQRGKRMVKESWTEGKVGA